MARRVHAGAVPGEVPLHARRQVALQRGKVGDGKQADGAAVGSGPQPLLDPDDQSRERITDCRRDSAGHRIAVHARRDHPVDGRLRVEGSGDIGAALLLGKAYRNPAEFFGWPAGGKHTNDRILGEEVIGIIGHLEFEAQTSLG